MEKPGKIVAPIVEDKLEEANNSERNISMFDKRK
jgi:hypothetical protein